MTDTSSSSDVGAASAPPPQRSRASRAAPPETTGWVGWIAFAAVLMVLTGVLHAIQGFVALFKDSYYIVTKQGFLATVDYTAWGWTHLLLGVLVALAGVALFSGRMWARAAGVALALLSILANFAFMPAYPLWAITLILVDIFVIYAIVVHGEEMRTRS
jgi:hypothetical protein